ncbi:ductus ejaculatorius peptide 99B [Drosophila yakuba]|uniref:Uncharacterized protein n=1 Tax=Drosophila yakuba TaxID=7245 RepID=A0A0R1EAV5_DROYA|nr:ductus ejaculatorius peptide 99B [Drosophila yakuba]KRK04183.1 uncharacterized protein Dyak_GE28720 [Drosophila yakuba]
MKTQVFLLLVILASLLGMAVSQNRTEAERQKTQEEFEKWCRLGHGFGGKCRK